MRLEAIEAPENTMLIPMPAGFISRVKGPYELEIEGPFKEYKWLKNGSLLIRFKIRADIEGEPLDRMCYRRIRGLIERNGTMVKYGTGGRRSTATTLEMLWGMK